MTTPYLAIPEVLEGQASFAVINNATRTLEAFSVGSIFQTGVNVVGDITSPQDGGFYLKTDDNLFYFTQGVFIEYTAFEGLRLYDTTTNALIVYSGGAWIQAIGSGINSFANLTDGTNTAIAASGNDTFEFIGANDVTVTVDAVLKTLTIDVDVSSNVDVLNTTLSGFSPSTATAIVATDTILEAFQKTQAYFDAFLTNFNGNDELVRLNSTGQLPKLDASLLTESIIYPIPTVAVIEDKNYTLFTHPSSASVNIRIDSVVNLELVSGTATVSFEIDGTPITGMDSLFVNSTPSVGTATASQTMTPGSVLTMVVTGSSSPEDFSCTITSTSNP